MANSHPLAGKYAILRSKCPLLGRRMAKIVDWWSNVASKVQDPNHWAAYQYRRHFYRLPDDTQAVWVSIDQANFIIHDSEIEEESITSIVNGTSWQDSSIDVLAGCVDIMVRRLSGEPDDSLATDYHGLDYELHPAVLKAADYLGDLTADRERLHNQATTGLAAQEQWTTAVKECLRLAKRGATKGCPYRKRQEILVKISELLGQLLNC